MLIHGIEFPDGVTMESEIQKTGSRVDQEDPALAPKMRVELIRISTYVTYKDISFYHDFDIVLDESEQFIRSEVDVFWLERRLREAQIGGNMQQIKDKLDAAIAEAANGV